MKTNGRRSSVDTRARILGAARRLFSKNGYERTTIRAVATAADIDPSMVMRYFVNKERLFTAAATIDLKFPDLSDLPRRNAGIAIIEHFLKLWEGPLSGKGLDVLLRSAVTHKAAAKRMQDVFQRQTLPFLQQFCSPEQAQECAALIVTQLLGLAYTRHVVRLPAVVALSQVVIRKRVGATIQAYLEMR